jgi:hypothetical protein
MQKPLGFGRRYNFSEVVALIRRWIREFMVRPELLKGRDNFSKVQRTCERKYTLRFDIGCKQSNSVKAGDVDNINKVF